MLLPAPFMGMILLCPFESAFGAVGHHHDLSVIDSVEIPYYVRAPVAVTYYPDANYTRHFHPH